MKYRRPIDKKEDRLAFGVWPTVPLADARAKRGDAKKLLVQGIDPKAEQKEVHAESAGVYTFETVARQWHASNKRWGDYHRSRVIRYLEMYIFPEIGSSDIRKLKTSHLLAPIKAVDDRASMTSLNGCNSALRRLCVTLSSMITLNLTLLAIWPGR